MFSTDQQKTAHQASRKRTAGVQKLSPFCV